MTSASGDSNSRQDAVTATLARARTIWGTRIAPALMAPLGILLTIPILVAGVGLAIWWQGHVAVDASVEALALQQFQDRAAQGAQHAQNLLAKAGPLTDNMVAYVKRVGLDPPLQDFALKFRDQLRAGSGVAYTSFGTYEGNYYGVYVDESGRYVHTNRVYGGPGKTHRREFIVGDDGTVAQFEEQFDHAFDPRLRPWWIAAVANGRRTWSEPYVWFDIGVVGITCSEPIWDDAGQLIAVTTADFHLNGLSDFVEELETKEGGRTFIFTDSYEIIAFPGAHQDFGQGQAKGSKLRVEDIEKDDPVVAALFDAMPDLRDELSPEFSFEVDGAPYLAALRPIQVGEDSRWFAATYGPTGPLTSPASEYQRNQLILSAIALAVAIVVAAFFARFIVTTHLQMKRAEHRALEADERLQRLGSYSLTRKLDEGGMGEVWIAEHAMLARRAAIKLIKSNYLQLMRGADRQQAIERFRREARTIARLRSRHTISIYDFGVADDGALFYVMELLDGIDLRTLVQRYGPVAQRRATHILLQAAWSLHEAHESGVVHRDIKPANIFLCREAEELDVVKVLDFGVARQVGGADAEATAADGLTGTPSCMSPEQVRDQKDLDGRSDIYSLGCVAYWLIAGRKLFLVESAMTMLLAQVKQTPEPLGRVAPGPLSPALEAIVMQCLAKKREDRPADMSVLARELERILAELPEDGWSTVARRAWWEAIPSLFDELTAEPSAAVRLRPDR